MYLQIIYNDVNKKCWFFHKLVLKYDTGYTQYLECKKCPTRKINQPERGVYQPINFEWLKGKTNNVTID
jgi:hypothetical protein